MIMIETAALAWYLAKKRREETLAALRAYWAEHGTCKVAGDDYGGEVPSLRGPCYQQAGSYWHLDVAEWCDVCRGSQPLYVARRKAAQAVGVALKALNRACNAAAEDRHD